MMTLTHFHCDSLPWRLSKYIRKLYFPDQALLVCVCVWFACWITCCFTEIKICFSVELLFVVRFVAGVIPREKVPGFERLLWFACRGNVFLRHEEIFQSLEDPMSVSVSCFLCLLLDSKTPTGGEGSLQIVQETWSDRLEWAHRWSMRLITFQNGL